MWTLRLAPQLTGKAQQAYTTLSAGDATDYSKVTEAILCRYNISEETYRQRFRGERRKAEEAYVELAARLRDLAGKWMVEGHMVEEVLEKLVVEQLANTMSAELRIWVAERKPKTGLEAGGLADDYLQARRNVRQGTRDMKKERARATPVSLVGATVVGQLITSSGTAQ